MNLREVIQNAVAEATNRFEQELQNIVGSTFDNLPKRARRDDDNPLLAQVNWLEKRVGALESNLAAVISNQGIAMVPNTDDNIGNIQGGQPAPVIWPDAWVERPD